MSALSERKKHYQDKSNARKEKRQKDTNHHSEVMKIIPQIYSNSTKTTGPDAGDISDINKRIDLLTSNVTKVEEKTVLLTNNITKVEEKTELLTNNVNKVEEKTELIVTNHTKFEKDVVETFDTYDDRMGLLEEATDETNERFEAEDVTAICNSITTGISLENVSYSLVTQFYTNRPVVYQHEECIRMIKELSVGDSSQTTSGISSSNIQTNGEAETSPITESKSIREINIAANRALIKDTALILMLKTEFVKMDEYKKVATVQDSDKKRALADKYGFILTNDIDDYEITSKEKGKDLREDEEGNFYLVCKNGTPSSGRFDGANRTDFIDTIGTIIDVDVNGMIDGTDVTIIAGCNSSTYTNFFGN